MRLVPIVLCLGMGILLGGCNEQAQSEADARGRLQGLCQVVYKSVEKVDLCNMIAQRHYDLEQKYYPNDPDKIADKVKDELWPSAAENERRRNESMAQGANYNGPPPSEMYEIMH